MSLTDRFFARLRADLLHSEQTSEPSARRRLRYMRLERRFLLSGDVGEFFEVDDDDFDDFDEIELWTDDDAEYDDDDDDDREHDADDRDEVVVVPTFSLPELEISDQSTSSENDLESPETENDSTEPNLTSQVDAEGELDTADTGPSLETEIGDSDLLRPHLTTTDEVLAAAESFEPLSNSEPETPVDARGRESSSIRVQVSNDIEITDALESTTPLVVEDALVEQSDSPVAIEALEQENTPDVQTHLPVENEPSKHEQLNSAAIGWLGSFADDLSAVDEALRELLDRRVAEQAISGVLRTGPLVAGGLITTGFAAQMAYQRARKQQSQLQDDHCSVQFDMRHYPELFG